MQQLMGEFSDAEVAAVTVDLVNRQAESRRVLESLKVTLPTVWDNAQAIIRAYSLRVTPSTVVVRKGGIVHFAVPAYEQAAIRQAIRGALEGTPVADTPPAQPPSGSAWRWLGPAAGVALFALLGAVLYLIRKG